LNGFILVLNGFKVGLGDTAYNRWRIFAELCDGITEIHFVPDCSKKLEPRLKTGRRNEQLCFFHGTWTNNTPCCLFYSTSQNSHFKHD
jgi:hypothetical protein